MKGEASGQGRVYQAGRDMNIKVERQTVLPTEALRPVTDVVASHLLFRHGRSAVFIGRTGDLMDLQDALATQARVVVSGLGGIGKSTLVSHYAATHSEDHNLVWSVTADSPSAINSGLATLATALQPELIEALPLEALTERATQWLATHDDWLLILDNVNHPTDIQPLLARLSSGRVLITSRLVTGWHSVTPAVLRLDVFQLGEAVELLTRILEQDRPDADLEGAGELCAELGYLPLAVEQAAAYMYQARIGPRAYSELLAQHTALVLDQAAEGTNIERTIARIWRITLDRLTSTPLAGEILRILAWYAPNAIPRGLLDPIADSALLQHAIGRLAAYDLVNIDDDGTLAVHRLVQAVARTPSHDDPHCQDADIASARMQAARLLTNAIPTDPRQPAGWPTWRILLPHITALIENSSADADSTSTAYLFNETGLFLLEQGAIGRAIKYYQRALDDYARILGDDHPNTLQARNNLAGAYETSGDVARAIPLHEQILAERERLLGSDHPDTIASRNNLGSAQQRAGNLDQAIALWEQTLSDCERVLGADHPYTLASRNNLAYAYESAGDLERAIPLCERALAERERVLGADHPGTLTSRNNLASAYESAGDVGRAIPLYERTLADSERILGAEHPNTLSCRNNLAYGYQAAGDLAKATSLFERNLADTERVLGADHPETLESRINLACAYQAARDLSSAIRLFTDSLAESRRLLGADHSLTRKIQTRLDELTEQ